MYLDDGPRQPMMTESAPIPAMQQAQALMARHMTATPQPTSKKKKIIVASVLGLLLAGGVAATLVFTDAGADDDSAAAKADEDAGSRADSKAKHGARDKHDGSQGKTPGDHKHKLPVSTPPKHKPKPHKKKPTAWAGHHTFRCRGDQVHVIRDVKAYTGRHTAIFTRDKCTVYCVNCTIRSRNRYAIKSYGRSKVILVGGRVVGRVYALYAMGASTIIRANTEVRGRRKHSRHGHIKKMGAADIRVP